MLKSRTYNLFFLFAAFSFGSGLNITAQLSAFVLVATLLALMNLTVISFNLKNIRLSSAGNSDLFAVLFLAVVFYTMLAKGIGFEMLGSTKSGGMFYVKLISVLLLFISALKLNVTDKYISKLFLCLCLSYVLPLVSDLIYLFWGETVFNQLVSGSSTIKFYAASDSILRIQAAAPLAEYLLVLTVVFFPLFNEQGKIRLNSINIILLTIVLVLIGLSGHRMTLIGVVLYVLIYYGYSFGAKKILKPVLIGGFIFLLLWIFVVIQFRSLPPSFQRVFSFLPFTPTNDITADASDSLNFRVLMAAKAYTMIPDYFLLGKGFAFFNRPVDLTDYFGIIDLYADIGVFHNGLLGLLVNLGFPGLAIGLALLFSIPKSFFGRRAVVSQGLLARILIAVKGKIVVVILYFIFLYGDVQTNFIEIVMLGLIYKLISYHFKISTEGTCNESFV